MMLSLFFIPALLPLPFSLSLCLSVSLIYRCRVDRGSKNESHSNQMFKVSSRVYRRLRACVVSYLNNFSVKVEATSLFF